MKAGKLDLKQVTGLGVRELAALLGMTTRRVQQLVDEGVITKQARGVYPLPDAVVQYCTHQRNELEKKMGTPAKGGIPAQKLKERELELKCQVLEQRVTEQREVIAEEVRTAYAEEMVEALSVIQGAYAKLKLPKKYNEPLRKAFASAITQLQGRGG